MDTQEHTSIITHMLQQTPDDFEWSDINYKAKANKHKKTHITLTKHIKDALNHEKIEGNTMSAIMSAMIKLNLQTYNSLFYPNIKLSQGTFPETHLLKKQINSTYLDKNTLSKTQFLAKTYHLIPVFTGPPDNGHWKLAVIKVNKYKKLKTKLKLQIYDSLAKYTHKDKTTENVLMTFLEETYGCTVETTKPFIKQQIDKKSCGHHTLAIAMAIYHDVNPNRLTPQIIIKLKDYIAFCLIHGYLSKSKFMEFINE